MKAAGEGDSRGRTEGRPWLLTSEEMSSPGVPTGGFVYDLSGDIDGLHDGAGHYAAVGIDDDARGHSGACLRYKGASYPKSK